MIQYFTNKVLIYLRKKILKIKKKKIYINISIFIEKKTIIIKQECFFIYSFEINILLFYIYKKLKFKFNYVKENEKF